MFDLAKKKPWIREECGWIIYRCIYDLSSKKVGPLYAEIAVERPCSCDLARTPEGVSIWLAVKDMFPGARFPANQWKHNDPLDSRERNQLAKVMKDSSVADPENPEQNSSAKSSGVWNSKLHFAWEALLSRVPEGSKKEKSKTKDASSRLSFVHFWTDIVDSKSIIYRLTSD